MYKNKRYSASCWTKNRFFVIKTDNYKLVKWIYDLKFWKTCKVIDWKSVSNKSLLYKTK